MKVKKGDTVKILSGKDKGKQGQVVRIFTAQGRVIVEGVNVLKKHVKPGQVSKEGGIISIERPIDISNVAKVKEAKKEVKKEKEVAKKKAPAKKAKK